MALIVVVAAEVESGDTNNERRLDIFEIILQCLDAFIQQIDKDQWPVEETFASTKILFCVVVFFTLATWSYLELPGATWYEAQSAHVVALFADMRVWEFANDNNTVRILLQVVFRL